MNPIPSEVRAAVRKANVVLFDFDGPLCDLFSHTPAHKVARHLESLIGREIATNDPLEVLRQSAPSGRAAVGIVEDALIDAEITAAHHGTVTPGGVEAVEAALAADMPVGVVSNNSREAVSLFLERVNLTSEVWPVIGRARYSPMKMKPSPWPLGTAMRKLGQPPEQALYVGDSLSDIEAAHAVGMPCVAYANKHGKHAKFTSAGGLVIEDMWHLQQAITER